MADNIILNKTLQEYNKKYRKGNFKLLKYTKKEVEQFDKYANKTLNTKNYLLKGRKWALIGDTYYEIPKAPRFTWFRNLNGAVQAGVCLLGAGVVATAITVPLVMTSKQSGGTEPIIDPSYQDDVNITFTEEREDGSKVYKVAAKSSSSKELTGIEAVYIGNDKLKITEEYTVQEENAKSINVIILKVAFEKHKGQVKVVPTVERKPQPTQKVTISLTASPAEGGTVEGGGEVDKGSTITIKATPNEGYTFTGWYIEEQEEPVSTDQEFNIVASQDASFEARFEEEITPLPDYLSIDEDGVISFNSSGTAPEELVIKSKYLVNETETPVNKIGDFSSVTSTSVTINNGITEINSNAFQSNSSIESIKIPTSIIKIGKYAFGSCSNLEDVEFTDTNCAWDFIDDFSGPVAKVPFTPTADTSKNAIALVNTYNNITWDKESDEKGDFELAISPETSLDPLVLDVGVTSGTIAISSESELPDNITIGEDSVSGNLLEINSGENNTFTIKANNSGTTNVILAGEDFNTKVLKVSVNMTDKEKFLLEYKKAYTNFVVLGNLTINDVTSYTSNGDDITELLNEINYDYNGTFPACTLSFNESVSEQNDSKSDVVIGGGCYAYDENESDGIQGFIENKEDNEGYTFTNYYYNSSNDDIGFDATDGDGNEIKLRFNSNGYVTKFVDTKQSIINDEIAYSSATKPIETHQLTMEDPEQQGEKYISNSFTKLDALSTHSIEIASIEEPINRVCLLSSDDDGQTFNHVSLQNNIINVFDVEIKDAESKVIEVSPKFDTAEGLTSGDIILDQPKLHANLEGPTVFREGSVKVTFKINSNGIPEHSNTKYYFASYFVED